MAKKTTKDIKAEILAKFGDTVELVGEYTTNKDPVTIRCRNCGAIFHPTIDNYLHKWRRPCHNCIPGNYFSRKTEQEDYESQVLEKWGEKITVLGEYQGYETPLLHRCNDCGREFEATPKNMLRRKVHCSCITKKGSNRKHSNEEFARRGAQVHGEGRYNYDKVEYVNVSSPVTITCPKHGDFQQSYDGHINKGYGCPQCANEERRYSFDDFAKEAHEVWGNEYIYPMQKLTNHHVPLRIICPKHGEFYKRRDAFLRDKQGCPKCVEEKHRDIWRQNFLDKAYKIHRDTYDYSNVKYVNNYTEVEIICPKHGPFWQTPHNHIGQHSGCPQCAKEKSSFGEKVIKRYLEEHGVAFIHDEPCLDWLVYDRKMKPDFYLPEHNVVIEFDGIQHFEPIETFGGEEALIETQKRDAEKDRLCEEHGVRVLRIPYWELDRIQDILKEVIKNPVN